MLDVTVILLRDGVRINGDGSDKESDDTAVLGKARLGRMKLGKA